MGVTGTLTTAYLTGRASFKAAAILEAEQSDAFGSDFRERNVGYSTKDKARIVWPHYIPAIGVGATTITSILLANQIASKKIAALAVASGISERAFQEYKAKVVEKLGETKEMGVRDQIAQERVDKHPIGTREIILAGTGEVLCFDMLTGRYFQSTIEDIKKAENKVNYDIFHHMYASLSSFYQEVGLPPTGYSDTVGWNSNTLLEVQFSTTLSTDQRPCVAVNFATLPVVDYERLY
jgi:hypothetical protein